MLSYEVETLANGLGFVQLPLPHLHSLYVGAFVRGGSDFESKSMSGVSHFVEHLHCTTSVNYPTRDLFSAAISRCPGSFQATTGRRMVSFCFYTSGSGIDRVADMLVEILTVREFPDDVVASERSLIVDEIAGSDTTFVMPHQWSVFGDHPFSRSPFGTVKSVKGLSSKSIHTFAKRLFQLESSVVVVVGECDSESTKVLKERLLGLGNMDAEPLETPPVPHPRLPRVDITHTKSRRGYLDIGFCLDGIVSENDWAALRVVEYIFGSPFAPLPSELRYMNPSAYYITSYLESYGKFAFVGMHASIHARRFCTFAEVVLRFIARFKEADLNRGWLEPIIETVVLGARTWLDSPSTVGEYIGVSALKTDRQPMILLQSMLSAFEQLTSDQVVDFVCRRFTADNIYFVGQRRAFLDVRRRIRSMVKDILG